MEFELSDKARTLQPRIRGFIHEEILPVEERLFGIAAEGG